LFKSVNVRLRNNRLQTKGKIKAILRIWIYIVLIIGAVSFILPLAWMVSTSLKVDRQIFVFPPVWLPNPVRWMNYVDAINYIPFLTYTLNTLYVSTLSVLGALIFSSLAAYGFSRIEWPGRNLLFILVLGTMMIPLPVYVIPLYVVFRNLHWTGTFKPLYLRFWFGYPLFIFLLRQFFMSIPKELSDAAKIDGCSELGIYWRVILPLSKPALAVVALFAFLYSWQDFLTPLIFITKQKMFTLSLGLQQYQAQHGGTEWNLLMAASTLMLLPIVVIFFLAQKTFIQGISLTGLKS